MNGNMIADDNKGFTVVYNHLNLPTGISYNKSNSVGFIYDATGRKLMKTVVTNGKSKSYTFVGSFIYENNLLTKIQTEEGAVNVSGSTYRYDYFLRDHLGSVRVVFNKGTNGQAQLLDENHYYPFGMLMAGEFERTEANTTLFCGKELNNEAYSGVKLSWYDFHARNYDPQLGTWFNVDPLAEKTMSYTPYHYCYGNPVNFVDPDGLMPKWLSEIYNSSGSGYTMWTKRTDGEWGIAERDVMYNSVMTRVGGRADMMRSGEITRAIFGYDERNIKIARSLRKYAESLSTHFTGTILIEGMDIAMNFDNGSYIASAYDYPTTVAQAGGNPNFLTASDGKIIATILNGIRVAGKDGSYKWSPYDLIDNFPTGGYSSGGIDFVGNVNVNGTSMTIHMQFGLWSNKGNIKYISYDPSDVNDYKSFNANVKLRNSSYHKTGNWFIWEYTPVSATYQIPSFFIQIKDRGGNISNDGVLYDFLGY